MYLIINLTPWQHRENCKKKFDYMYCSCDAFCHYFQGFSKNIKVLFDNKLSLENWKHWFSKAKYKPVLKNNSNKVSSGVLDVFSCEVYGKSIIIFIAKINNNDINTDG